MFNVALGFAFLISLLSPGRWLLRLLVGSPELHGLTAGQRLIVLGIADYWLPAALIYLVLRLIPQAVRLTPTSTEAKTLRICNSVIALYVIVRLYAATIEGGGAGYTVALLGAIPALLALVFVGIVLVRLMARALAKKPIDLQARELRILEILAIAFFGFGPSLYVAKTVFVGEGSPKRASENVDRRLSELCAKASQRFLRVPQGVESLYFGHTEHVDLERLGPGEFVEKGTSGGSIVPLLLYRGQLQFYEMNEYVPGGGGQWHLMRTSLGAPVPSAIQGEPDFPPLIKVPIDVIESQFGFHFTSIATQDDQKLGIRGYEMSVKEQSSGKSIATSSYFVNPKNRRICADKSAEWIDSLKFVQQALNLPERSR